MTGFSVGGRVVDGNDMGIEGVSIIVDRQERSITDKQGYYKLDQVSFSLFLSLPPSPMLISATISKSATDCLCENKYGTLTFLSCGAYDR